MKNATVDYMCAKQSYVPMTENSWHLQIQMNETLNSISPDSLTYNFHQQSFKLWQSVVTWVKRKTSLFGR